MFIFSFINTFIIYIKHYQMILCSSLDLNIQKLDECTWVLTINS